MKLSSIQVDQRLKHGSLVFKAARNKTFSRGAQKHREYLCKLRIGGGRGALGLGVFVIFVDPDQRKTIETMSLAVTSQNQSVGLIAPPLERIYGPDSQGALGSYGIAIVRVSIFLVRLPVLFSKRALLGIERSTRPYYKLRLLASMCDYLVSRPHKKSSPGQKSKEKRSRLPNTSK